MTQRPLPVCIGLALLAGCAGGPPATDWQVAAHGNLQRYQKAWLAGAGRAADAEFSLARRELAATGQARLVARAELTRCALRVAALEFSECEGFAPLAADAGPQEQAYATWLAGGALAPDEVARLPAQHRRTAGAGASAVATLRGIEDPLSRLVAAGVHVRRGTANQDVVSLAVETASQQGWRRPLLAWLGLELRLAEAAGDPSRAAQVRRRMDLAGRTAGHRE